MTQEQVAPPSGGNGLFRRTGQADQPVHLKVLVSGPPKSGKTTLLGTVPNILVLDTEPDANNIESIAHLNVAHVEIRDTAALKQVLFLLSQPMMRKQVAAQYGWDDVGAVAIDTMDSLQRIMKRERMAETHKADFVRDDWGWLKIEMQSLVAAFTKLPMHVFFMVHLGSKEIGKGENAFQQVTVGLEGAIANELPGMVGYSLLAFRQPVLQSDGTTKTEYFLRAEGDESYDFLGTRTAGRLPSVIRPDMAHIYNAVLEGRKQAAEAMGPPPPPMVPMDLPAQTPGQVQPTMAPPPPAPYDGPQQPMPGTVVSQPGTQPSQQQAPPVAQQAPGQPDMPADDEPVNVAALVHVKRVYDAMQMPFPEEKVRALTIGQARDVVRYWNATQQDAVNGTAPEGSTPQSVMFDILKSHNLLPDESQEQPAPAAPVEPRVDGTIEQVDLYVRNGVPNGEVDLAKVQEAYYTEIHRVNGKGEPASRKSLISKLESLGAQTQAGQPPAPGSSPAVQEAVVAAQQPPAEQVQTPVQTPQEPVQQPQEPVTQQAPPADVLSTGGVVGDAGGGAAMEQAIQTVQDGGLGNEVIAQAVTPGAPCAQCGKPHDDPDLAELARTRFGKILCVEHYLEATRAAKAPSN